MWAEHMTQNKKTGTRVLSLLAYGMEDKSFKFSNNQFLYDMLRITQTFYTKWIAQAQLAIWILS